MKVFTTRGKKRFRRVSELLDDQGNWKEAMVRSNFLPIDVEVILKIKPSRRLDNDLIAWQPEGSGHFTVRSAYKLAFNESSDQCAFAATSSVPDGANSCWKRIWHADVPPKVKNFAFKAASNGLALEKNKKDRGFEVTGRCLICDKEQEDMAHALFKCFHANNLWKVMRSTWLLPTADVMQAPSSNWFASILEAIPVSMIDAFLLVAWRIWFAHNEVTHDKDLPSIEGSKIFLLSYIRTLKSIKSLSTEEVIKGKCAKFMDTIKPTLTCEPSPGNLRWLMPTPGWVKLNCDGSY
jgi:hypothetical protein